jgi:putative transposase
MRAPARIVKVIIIMRPGGRIVQPPRLYEDNSDYFLTFNTYRRKNVLCIGAIPELIIDSFRFQCRNLNLDLDAFVVMPDHIHLSISCKNAKNVSRFLKHFKSYTSRNIKEILNCDGKYFWQRGTYDHVINDEDDYWNHVDYIHYNPVKHGFVRKPESWKWSSYKDYLNKGIYEVGWGYKEIDFKSKKKYSWGE